MAVAPEIRAAVGEIVIEVTWVEYQIARLVRMAGLTDDEVALLGPGAPLFSLARRAVSHLRDTQAAEQTRRWLAGGEELRAERHRVVHSIVMHEHQDVWQAHHPKSGQVLILSVGELAALAGRVRACAEEGTELSLFVWPQALGRLDAGQD